MRVRVRVRPFWVRTECRSPPGAYSITIHRDVEVSKDPMYRTKVGCLSERRIDSSVATLAS